MYLRGVVPARRLTPRAVARAARVQRVIARRAAMTSEAVKVAIVEIARRAVKAMSVRASAAMTNVGTIRVHPTALAASVVMMNRVGIARHVETIRAHRIVHAARALRGRENAIAGIARRAAKVMNVHASVGTTSGRTIRVHQIVRAVSAAMMSRVEIARHIGTIRAHRIVHADRVLRGRGNAIAGIARHVVRAKVGIVRAAPAPKDRGNAIVEIDRRAVKGMVGIVRASAVTMIKVEIARAARVPKDRGIAIVEIARRAVRGIAKIARAAPAGMTIRATARAARALRVEIALAGVLIGLRAAANVQMNRITTKNRVYVAGNIGAGIRRHAAPVRVAALDFTDDRPRCLSLVRKYQLHQHAECTGYRAGHSADESHFAA
jgi:hypothetical protein